MKPLLRILVLTVYSTVMIGIIGCGESDGRDAAFIQATPSDNSTLESGETLSIIVTFDNTPVNLYIETKGLSKPPIWELNGRRLTILKETKKHWDDFDYTIIITWATGRKILNYKFRGGSITI